MQQSNGEFNCAVQGVDLSFLEMGHDVSQQPVAAVSGDFRPRNPIGDGREILFDSCSCLHHQTRFLSEMKKIEGRYSLTPVPIILQATQDSKALWESLSHCSSCRCDRDSVAVLILAMSLRHILRQFQSFISKEQSSSAGHLSWIGTSSAASNRRSIYDQAGVEGLNRESHGLTTNTIRMGRFEIPHDEQAFLTDVLISRILSKIKWTHESMMDYIKRVHENPFATLAPREGRFTLF